MHGTRCTASAKITLMGLSQKPCVEGGKIARFAHKNKGPGCRWGELQQLSSDAPGIVLDRGTHFVVRLQRAEQAQQVKVMRKLVSNQHAKDHVVISVVPSGMICLEFPTGGGRETHNVGVLRRGSCIPGALHLGSRLRVLGGFTTCEPSYLGGCAPSLQSWPRGMKLHQSRLIQ